MNTTEEKRGERQDFDAPRGDANNGEGPPEPERTFQGGKLALAWLGVVLFMAAVAALVDWLVVPR